MFLCHEEVIQTSMYPITFFRISGFFDGCISREGAI